MRKQEDPRRLVENHHRWLIVLLLWEEILPPESKDGGWSKSHWPLASMVMLTHMHVHLNVHAHTNKYLQHPCIHTHRNIYIQGNLCSAVGKSFTIQSLQLQNRKVILFLQYHACSLGIATHALSACCDHGKMSSTPPSLPFLHNPSLTPDRDGIILALELTRQFFNAAPWR